MELEELTNEQIAENISELCKNKNYHKIKDILIEINPTDVAAIFEELPTEQRLLLFRLLPKEEAAETFVELNGDTQEALITAFSDTELKEVIDELYLDDTVDIIEEMPATVVKRILKNTDTQTRKSINTLLKYPEDSAGSIMTPEFVDLKKDSTVEDAFKRIRRTGVDKETIYTCYVTRDRKLIGIVTNRDLRFQPDMSRRIGEVMTPGDRLITTHRTELEHASAVLLNNKIEKLPVVDDEGRLVGLITYKDITKVQDHPNACKDAKGRLRVAAGVGITADALERVAALVAEDVDAVVLDSAHGHSRNIVRTLRQIKEAYPSLDVVVGNIATGEAAKFLIDAGADGIKVGIGPGSICTTRIIAGVGVPQLSAIYAAASAAKGSGVPVIADGGLRYSGDIVKALAAGGDSVMIGSMFAGTEEAPGETIIYNGRKFKAYRGMGSIDAMKAGSADRYFQKGCEGNINKLVPEGIVARVPFKGALSETVYQLIGGLRSGMGYCGAKDIPTLQTAKFIRITASGMHESHPHDVTITSEAPNYSSER